MQANESSIIVIGQEILHVLRRIIYQQKLYIKKTKYIL